jgi:hypothetical protein
MTEALRTLWGGCPAPARDPPACVSPLPLHPPCQHPAARLLRAALGAPPVLMDRLRRAFLYAVALVAIPFGMYYPSGVVLLWASTGVFSFAQVGFQGFYRIFETLKTRLRPGGCCGAAWPARTGWVRVHLQVHVTGHPFSFCVVRAGRVYKGGWVG